MQKLWKPFLLLAAAGVMVFGVLSSGAWFTDGATSGATVDLMDGNGNVLKTIDLGNRSAGDVNFYWDGKDEAGNRVATDALKIRVNGATPSRVASWATIAAVQSPADGSASKLITALGSYSPSDAISLS